MIVKAVSHYFRKMSFRPDLLFSSDAAQVLRQTHWNTMKKLNFIFCGYVRFPTVLIPRRVTGKPRRKKFRVVLCEQKANSLIPMSYFPSLLQDFTNESRGNVQLYGILRLTRAAAGLECLPSETTKIGIGARWLTTTPLDDKLSCRVVEEILYNFLHNQISHVFLGLTFFA